MNGLPELIKEAVRERAEELPVTPVPWGDLRRRRRQRSLRLGGTAAVVATACGAALVAGQLGPWGGPEDSAVVPAISAPVRVSGLAGEWKVAAAGLAGPTTLRFGAGVGLLSGQGCDLSFDWIGAVDGQFAASPGMSASCGQGDPEPGPITLPAWLQDALRFRAEGTGWSLLNGDGDVTARLSPSTSLDLKAAELVPMPGAEEKAKLDRVLPPLPAGRRPVTADQLVGTWAVAGSSAAPGSEPPQSPEPSLSVPAGQDAARSSTEVTFTPNGGRDAVGPRWLVDPLGGVLLGNQGPHLLICVSVPAEPGCVNASSWFDGSRVAHEDGRLVVYDASGRAVHRLVRR
jgi:hypothetical protein